MRMRLASFPNYVHCLLHHPDRGWDPLSAEHTRTHADFVWSDTEATNAALATIKSTCPTLLRKRVLDLGGGPAQISISLAKEGASVTWHDISENYKAIAERKALEEKVSIDFSIGYLEEADKFHASPFDIVIARYCWHYCMNDRAFAELLAEITTPGGFIFVWTNNSQLLQKPDAKFSLFSRLAHEVNKLTGVKLGHPYPPSGRIAAAFAGLGCARVTPLYEDPYFDLVIVER